MTSVRRFFRELCSRPAIRELQRANTALEQQVKDRSDELALALERLDLTQTAAGLTSWEWDLAADTMSWTAGRPNLHVLGANPTVKYRDVIAGVHPEDQQATLTAAQAAVATRGVFQHDFRVMRPDGTVRWVHSRGKVFVDAAGAPRRMLGVNIDLTDRKSLESVLKEKERRYRAVFEQMSVGIAYVLPQGALRMPNQKLCAMLGCALDDITGGTLTDLIHPDERDEARGLSAKVLTGELQAYTRAVRLRRQDGGWLPVEMTISSANDGDGAAGYAVVFVKDISCRAAAEQALTASEARFRTLTEALPQLVWTCDGVGVLDFVNQRWQEFFATPSAAALAGGLWDGLHADDRARTLATWQRCSTMAWPFEVEHRLRRADGAYRWMLCRALPVLDEAGRVRKWIGTETDITEKHLVAEQMRRAITAADAANEAKSRFLANVSHEIRTPLTAILGFSELIQLRASADADRARYVDAIIRNSRALHRLIDDLLDLSKIEAGRVDLEHLETPLAELLEDVRSLFQPQVAAKGVRLVLSHHGDVPATIYADPARVRQILVNVVGNAVKFTSQGEVVISAAVEDGPEVGAAVLEVSVRDSGIGISPAQQATLFQSFSQVDASTTRKFGGTGLGLALSRRLARLMGGDLMLARSAAGAGSTFALRLPVGRSAGGPLSGADPLLPDGRRSDIGGARVLVVEDSVDSSDYLGQVLALAGAHVEVAANGRDAVSKAVGGDFAVILMDVQMPVLDGCEATIELRALGYKRPIIALTAHALSGERDRCLKAGCDAHVTKPIGSADIIELVASYLRKNDATG